jgi:hypothetical protein
VSSLILLGARRTFAGRDINPSNLIADALVKFRQGNSQASGEAPPKEQGADVGPHCAAQETAQVSETVQADSARLLAREIPRLLGRDNRAWDTMPKVSNKPPRIQREAVSFCPSSNQWVCHSSNECSRTLPTRADLPLVRLAPLQKFSPTQAAKPQHRGDHGKMRLSR